MNSSASWCRPQRRWPYSQIRSDPAPSGSNRTCRRPRARWGLRCSWSKLTRTTIFDPAFATARAGAGALIVSADPFFFARRDRIVALAERHSLPTMYFFREFVAAGGLVSYGSNLGNAYYHIGMYAGKILKGLNPAEMPMVQQSDKLELVINLKTAKALSIQVPATLQTSADEVIE